MQQDRALARDSALSFESHHIEGEVRAVKAGADRHPVAQPKPLGDLTRDPRRRRRRRPHHRGAPRSRRDARAAARVP